MKTKANHLERTNLQQNQTIQNKQITTESNHPNKQITKGSNHSEQANQNRSKPF
jgi:hypothetical protein